MSQEGLYNTSVCGDRALAAATDRHTMPDLVLVLESMTQIPGQQALNLLADQNIKMSEAKDALKRLNRLIKNPRQKGVSRPPLSEVLVDSHVVVLCGVSMHTLNLVVVTSLSWERRPSLRNARSIKAATKPPLSVSTSFWIGFGNAIENTLVSENTCVISLNFLVINLESSVAVLARGTTPH